MNITALCYAYGAVAPLENPFVEEEIERMRIFRNALIASDRAADLREEEAMIEAMPEYASAKSELDSAWDALRAAIAKRNADRAATGSKKSDLDPEVKASVKVRNEARAKCWALAKQWRADNKDICRSLEAQRHAANKVMRQSCGLYWGNYNRIIQDFESARKTCRQKGRHLRESDLSRSDACLTIQIQRTRTGLGASFAELMNGSVSAIQIGRVPAGIDVLSTGARSRACRTRLEMRIDALGNMLRTDVWMHRPVPAGYRIKSAQLAWRAEGENMPARLCLTIAPEKEIEAHRHESMRAAGVDLGWRLNPDGSLMIATSLNSSGNLYHHCLPRKWMDGMDQVERLAGYVDDGLLAIGQWIRGRSDVPELIVDAIGQWMPGMGARHINAKALHDAVRTINGICRGEGRHARRNPRGHRVPAEIRAWYDRYRHLSLWRDNLRARLLRERREIYRLLARKLAMDYAVLGIEDMDLSRIARTKNRDDAMPSELHAQARAQRVRACVHSLRAEIEHQAAKHGAEVVYKTKDTTQLCRQCGEITGQMDRSVLVWTCTHCGTQWDQDANAAGNLLDAATGVTSSPSPKDSGNGKTKDSERKKMPKWKRSKKVPDTASASGP